MTDFLLFCGPMSKNVVDAVLATYMNGFSVGFIPSRRQVDFETGYVNNWRTDTFSSYVKNIQPEISICRDHGGPGQGQVDDDGVTSFLHDVERFDIVHIDPWYKYPNLDQGIAMTIELIIRCASKSDTCLFEVGTEEAIRPFSIDEFEKLVYQLKSDLPKQLFDRIVYGVVQSGVGLNLIDKINTGTFKPEVLTQMHDICTKSGLLSKEHNGDYLSHKDVRARRQLGLNSLNIAPELGQIETQCYVELFDRLPESMMDRLFHICNRSKRWEKWVPSGFDPVFNKRKIIGVCGHYIFSDSEFISLLNEVL